jgi:uncharacterized membrane protein YbhN (UPF0104 family)
MWRVLTKLAVSALLIWLLVRGRDLNGLLHQIATVDRLAVLACVVLLVVVLLLQTLRWSTILAAMGFSRPFASLFSIVYIGAFFSQALPAATSFVSGL